MRRTLAIVFLFFFCSGVSALVYEVSWVRLLSLTLGNTAAATSCVLGVFMGGLAIGAYVGGRVSDRIKHWLACYGAIEFAIGITSLLVSEGLRQAPVIFVAMERHFGMGAMQSVASRLIFSSALLLVPTILMGATLPILIRAVKNRPSKSFNQLYEANILGAIGGSLFACFVGFAYMGVQETLFFAAAINFAVGISAFVIGKNAEPDEVETKSQGIATDATPGSSGSLTYLCLLSFLTGFTALSYEVLWTRLLRFYLSSLTYTFTIMVSMFLLGMAIGCWIYQRRFYKEGLNFGEQCWRLSRIQFLGAIACAGSLLTVPISQALRAYWVLPLGNPLNAPAGNICFWFAAAAISILIPATIIGISFPIIGALSAEQEKVGSAVGAAYAANTLGCVLGSVITGLVLMPAIGSYRAFQVIVLCTVITGAIAALRAPITGAFRRAAIIAVPICLALAFIAFVDMPFYSFLMWGNDVQLLKQGEDTTGIMLVAQFADGKELVLNGSCLATTFMPSRRYMRMLGHLPVMINPNPEDALVGCFGTGTTAGAVAMHPEVKHEDIVELSSMVLKSGELFSDSNYHVLRNPKVNPRVMDVRNYLLSSDKKYDLITFEPPPPAEAGIVNLYSEEFYRLVRAHLKSRGVACQWVPFHEESETLWKQMVRSARNVFPEVTVWLPNSGEALLLMSADPIKIDINQMKERMNDSPLVKKSLEDVGLGDPSEVVASLVLCGKTLDDYLGDAPPITDNHPRLEFFIPYAGPNVREPDIEKVGADGVDKYLRAQVPQGFLDSDEYKRNWMAVHLLRSLEDVKSPADKRAAINKALEFAPDNHWFKWVKTHPSDFGG